MLLARNEQGSCRELEVQTKRALVTLTGLPPAVEKGFARRVWKQDIGRLIDWRLWLFIIRGMGTLGDSQPV